jgi:hypothetical protein
MNKTRMWWFALGIAAVVAVGCNQGNSSPAGSAASVEPAPASSRYLLSAEPAGAKGVSEVRKSSKAGDEVTLAGRVGGDVDPFVEGVAIFTIVDLSKKPCGEGCPTPWDYCCTADLPENKAIIKVVDPQGSPVAEDARKLLGIKPLSSVVVRGKVNRDDAGNLIVLAEAIYVKRGNQRRRVKK